MCLGSGGDWPVGIFKGVAERVGISGFGPDFKVATTIIMYRVGHITGSRKIENSSSSALAVRQLLARAHLSFAPSWRASRASSPRYQVCCLAPSSRGARIL